MHLQDVISSLNDFWKKQGCSVLQPHYLPIGAGTLHPATIFGTLKNRNNYNIAYVQPSVRPNDSRAGRNPNRLSHYFQYQVIRNPFPIEIQELYLQSLEFIGLDCSSNDIRFIEDDWENPSVGAYGVGWEVWLNGIEISQFTYMQQIGGIPCSPNICELTYGLERITMHLQEVDNIFSIKWSEDQTYSQLFRKHEEDLLQSMKYGYSIEILKNNFNIDRDTAYKLLEKGAVLTAYNYCLKAIDSFNMLDAKGAMGNIERAKYIIKTKEIVNACCKKWIEQDTDGANNE